MSLHAHTLCVLIILSDYSWNHTPPASQAKLLPFLGRLCLQTDSYSWEDLYSTLREVTFPSGSILLDDFSSSRKSIHSTSILRAFFLEWEGMIADPKHDDPANARIKFERYSPIGLFIRQAINAALSLSLPAIQSLFYDVHQASTILESDQPRSTIIDQLHQRFSPKVPNGNWAAPRESWVDTPIPSPSEIFNAFAHTAGISSAYHSVNMAISAAKLGFPSALPMLIQCHDTALRSKELDTLTLLQPWVDMVKLKDDPRRLEGVHDSPNPSTRLICAAPLVDIISAVISSPGPSSSDPVSSIISALHGDKAMATNALLAHALNPIRGDNLDTFPWDLYASLKHTPISETDRAVIHLSIAEAALMEGGTVNLPAILENIPKATGSLHLKDILRLLLEAEWALEEGDSSRTTHLLKQILPYARSLRRSLASEDISLKSAVDLLDAKLCIDRVVSTMDRNTPPPDSNPADLTRAKELLQRVQMGYGSASHCDERYKEEAEVYSALLKDIRQRVLQ